MEGRCSAGQSSQWAEEEEEEEEEEVSLSLNDAHL